MFIEYWTLFRRHRIFVRSEVTRSYLCLTFDEMRGQEKRVSWKWQKSGRGTGRRKEDYGNFVGRNESLNGRRGRDMKLWNFKELLWMEESKIEHFSSLFFQSFEEQRTVQGISQDKKENIFNFQKFYKFFFKKSENCCWVEQNYCIKTEELEQQKTSWNFEKVVEISFFRLLEFKKTHKKRGQPLSVHRSNFVSFSFKTNTRQKGMREREDGGVAVIWSGGWGVRWRHVSLWMNGRNENTWRAKVWEKCQGDGGEWWTAN